MVLETATHSHKYARTVLKMHLLSWWRTHTPYSSTMCLWATCRIMLAVSKNACQHKDKDQMLKKRPANKYWLQDGKMLQNWSSQSPHENSTCTGSVSMSYQGDVPVSRTQHLQDHLDLLEGRVTCILVLLTLHLQCARVDVGFCAPSKVLILVTTTEKKTVRSSIQTMATKTTGFLKHLFNTYFVQTPECLHIQGIPFSLTYFNCKWYGKRED